VTSTDSEEILLEYHAKGTDFYAKELEDLIAKEGADTISTFLMEPVSGSSTGAWIAPKGYGARMREICNRHKILIIADEVMCGAGRTGTFFASEPMELKPDVLVLGKGINAGLMPVAALLVKESDVNSMKAASGGFMHAQTYMQAPSMAATALAVLTYLDQHQVLEKAKPVSAIFQRELQEQILPLPHVGSVTGIGHMAGVEFVANKSTKAPYPIAQKFVQKFVTHAQDQGLILWPNYGQADGVNGDLVMLGPPLTMSESEARECVTLLKHSIATFQF
jgi:adenosylmethionine-8-amino-7-oxononanoate aminotransferase